MRIWLTIALLATSQLHAREFSTSLSPGRHVQIGQPVTITLEAKGTGQPQWPAISDSTLSPFETLSTDTLQHAEGLYRYAITLTCFDTGWHIIPHLPVFIDDAQLLTDSFHIHVRLVDVDTSAEIKDIKSIYEAGGSANNQAEDEEGWLAKNWYWLLAGATLLGVVMFMLWKRRKQIGEAIPPPLPPAEEAIFKLQQLKERKLWEAGNHKAFHVELSDILRTYVERRFGVRAMEQTTDELIPNLRLTMDDETALRLLKQTLKLSDMVKFAKQTPLGSENETCFSNAFEFVSLTKPNNDLSQDSNEDA